MKTLKPKKGDVKEFHGLRFVHNGQFWLADNVVGAIIDHHHNQRGQQDAKRPYRGSKEAHVICGNKLLR